MRLLFIVPYIFNSYPKKRSSNYFPGVASLSAYLKKHGHSVRLLQYLRAPLKKQLISQVLKDSPDIIGFSSTTHMFYYVKQWAKWIKEESDVLTICGGIHPTIDSDNSITQDGIDMICVGEGEEPLLEVCMRYENKESLTDIPNIWIKRDGRIYKNPVRPLIDDLDRLPFPDRGIFNPAVDSMLGYNVVKVMVSRGCPYDCNYCCTPKLKEIYNGRFKNFTRFRSVENSVQYLENLIRDYPSIECIQFVDDIFNFNKEWLRDFAYSYNKRIGLPYLCQSHVHFIDRETAGLLKHSGCKKIYIGIESGNDYIRKKIYNKRTEREQIVRAFRLLQEEGVPTYAFNMIGAPFENMRNILESIKLNVEAGVLNGIGIGDGPSIFYPYHGTRLYRFCSDRKMIGASGGFGTYLEGSMLSQASIGSREVVFAMHVFMLFVRLYRMAGRLPKGLRVLCNAALDRVFLCRASSLITPFLLYFKRSMSAIYDLEISFEAWARGRFPKVRPILNVLNKR